MKLSTLTFSLLVVLGALLPGSGFIAADEVSDRSIYRRLEARFNESNDQVCVTFRRLMKEARDGGATIEAKNAYLAIRRERDRIWERLLSVTSMRPTWKMPRYDSCDLGGAPATKKPDTGNVFAAVDHLIRARLEQGALTIARIIELPATPIPCGEVVVAAEGGTE